MKKRFLILLISFLLSVFSYAANASFVVKNIEIKGLQGISRDTVLSYLPIKIGDTIDEEQSNKIIQELFKTGFFENINLEQHGNVLIINVEQRPIISHITITGNSEISTSKLTQALKTQGFSEGQVFNNALLEKIKTSLAREYFAIGKYNSAINVNVAKEDRNRVAIKIDISEGVISKIHKITIIGSHTVTERELLKQFKLSTTNLLSFFTKDDQYSREKLEADLESLKSYYMDRGYLKFKIESTQVSLSPDKKQVYITIDISEGPQYKISGYNIEGNLILPKQKIEDLMNIKAGQIFSRKDIMDSTSRVAKELGTKGYANANVNVAPQINEDNKTVFLKCKVEPGPRMYVRNITFSENYRTNDEVLRRSLLQMEGSVLSTTSIEESKRNLLLLPYIRDAQVTTVPVAGKPDQVDVNYKITEQVAGELKGGIGYSQTNKLMVNAGVNQRNIFGTGNSLGLNAMYSRPRREINFDFYNPYFTKSGVGMGINVSGTQFDASKANITSYALNEYGVSMRYDLPLTSKNNTIEFGYGYENTSLNVGKSPSTQLLNFKDKYGVHFYQARINAAWNYMGFDRYIFPTAGFRNKFLVWATVPLSSNKSLEYYKVTYKAEYYHPIYKEFIGNIRCDFGYGNGYGRFKNDLPFFRNFYSGGMDSVRGYDGNTLGPRDSKNDPLGGNFEADASIGLVVPNPISNNVRTTIFVDGGNVYSGFRINNLRDLRFSSGIQVEWLSPIAKLNFSLAKALNTKHGDKTQLFQFSIGTSF